MKKIVLLTVGMLLVLLLCVSCAPAASSAGTPQAAPVTQSIVEDTLKTEIVGSSLGAGVFALCLVLALTVGTFIGLPFLFKSMKYSQKLMIAAVVALVGLGITLFQGSYVAMDQTRVGLVLFQGKAVRAMQPGPNWVIPYLESGVTFPRGDWTYVTSLNPAQGDEDFRDISVDFLVADGVNCRATYTIQGRINPEMIVTIYERYGNLENAILQLVKSPSRVKVRELMNKQPSAKLITDLDTLSGDAVDQIKPTMVEGGLQLIAFGFRKPQLGLDLNGNGIGDFEENLDSQRAAEELAKAQEELVKVEEAKAKQAAAIAEGQKLAAIKVAEAQAQSTLINQKAQAEATLYTAKQNAEAVKVAADATAYKTEKEATAQAEANKKLASTVTTQLIEYLKWSHWNGVLPQWVSDMGKLFVTTPAPTAGQ
jgi:regulator of protease activity HflC (stomatin/prohibitin superfamily)